MSHCAVTDEPFHVRDDWVADWLQNWYLVRETGETLYGVDASAVVPPVTWAEFVDATARYAIELRHKSHAGASSGALAYAILTQCRALSAVETGERVSKQNAAAWTRERMLEWAWLIDLALECRSSRGTMGFDDDRSRAAAEQFIGLLADEVGAPRSADSRR